MIDVTVRWGSGRDDKAIKGMVNFSIIFFAGLNKLVKQKIEQNKKFKTNKTKRTQHKQYSTTQQILKN